RISTRDVLRSGLRRKPERLVDFNSIVRGHSGYKINWARYNRLADAIESKRINQNLLSITMIQGKETAREFHWFAAGQKCGMNAVLQCAGNYRARADAGVHVPVAKNFFVVLPRFAKLLCKIEHSAHCLLGMLTADIRKSKNCDDTFTIGSLQKSSSFDQTVSGLANKFRHRFSETDRIRVIRDPMSVGNIADDHTRFVRFRLAIERAAVNLTKFFFREAIRKNCPH